MKNEKTDIRQYRPSDCKEITELFYGTVHRVNSADYTKEQLDVWAPEQADLEKWNSSFLEHYSIVAVEGGKITGFGDIDETGYLDRPFFEKRGYRVVKEQQVERQGILLTNYVMEKKYYSK